MDNLYQSCPPRMEYGGVWTDYRPRCVANADISVLKMNSEEYRQSLIENGAAMIQQNRAMTEFKFGCSTPLNQPTIPGFAVTQECSSNVCIIKDTNTGGLGLGNVQSTVL